MKKDFICPYCKGKLNVKNYIVFSVKCQTGCRGIILLSPKLGDYKSITHPSLKIEDGDHIEYHCPICHSNLAALEFNEDLVKVLMSDENQHVYEVLFSGIAGEHCTYVLHDQEMETFGENSSKYMNYLSETHRF